MADGDGFPRADEALRLLAGAVGAARLYPPGSAIPLAAAARFTERSNDLAAAGPLRFSVDPHGFRIADTEVASGQSQVVALAESMHAMQVGQLVIAPGITPAETAAFVALANSEPTTIRSSGGLRSAMGSAGIRHIAVIEVTLRASDESGLLGVDLVTAPLEEIASAVLEAVEKRGAEAQTGTASDEMAAAIERLEDATRELAMERVASALMRLDEKSRERILGLSLAADQSGHRMEGMLSVIARMKPAALARLLRLVATQAETDARRIAGALELPPETMKALDLMLSSAPDVAPDFGLSDAQQARDLASEMATEEDTSDLDRQVAIASPILTASRALATATAVSRARLDTDSVRSIGDSLAQAARDGAFTTVREALRRLDEIATEPALANEVMSARATLADPLVLADVCRVAQTDADAAIAGEILHAAGPLGAEALVNAYIRVSEGQRSLLRPVLRGMSEGVLGVARTKLRGSDTLVSVAIVRALPSLGDRRAAMVIGEALEGSLDEPVRFAAASALSQMPVPEAERALIKAINHREPETARFVIREIGRARLEAAVPSLARAFEDINVLSRTYETRKEIIGALAAIGSPEALKVLKRYSIRQPFLGRKSRELKNFAKRAVDELSRTRGVDTP